MGRGDHPHHDDAQSQTAREPGKGLIERLSANAVDLLPEGRLAEQLELGRPLRVKFGIDPTAPDIHLGHTVVLSRLRAFQDAGHTVVLIIGDYTARVGDPSGRSSTRPALDPAEIDANAKTFQDQAFKILDPAHTEIRFNSEWLDMPSAELFRLMSRCTLSQLTERDDISSRIKNGRPVSLLELTYPLLQGFDSVVVGADVELGGQDQRLNLLFARDVQVSEVTEPQSILTLPILPGTDGIDRMSKSSGNYIALTDPPAEMFGKLMSIPDQVMGTYYRLLLERDLDSKQHPVAAKRHLGRKIVSRFHGVEAASEAESTFDLIHVQRAIPEEIEEAWIESGPLHLPALLAEHFQISRAEARRRIDSGAVRIGDRKLGEGEYDLDAAKIDGEALRFGKRGFLRLFVSR